VAVRAKNAYFAVALGVKENKFSISATDRTCYVDTPMKRASTLSRTLRNSERFDYSINFLNCLAEI
jgi:hypothetical protein